MSECKCKKPTKAIIEAENKRLREENYELRKFVNYVRSLKTDEDFLKLREVLQQADEKFSSKEE